MDTTATTATPFYVKPEITPERKAFYEKLDAKSTAPLWEALGRLVTSEPQPKIVPALWKYEELRPLIMEGGRLITAKEADRRVLVLENPGIRGLSQITQSLYAGLQLILPGEVAPTHRHKAAALRFIVEGNGAYTSVDGERTTMKPGDFVLTPSWTFHDHGNESQEPMVWLDGLDLPIVNMFDASFAEHHPMETQPLSRPEGDALARYGGNVLPIEYTAPTMAAPIFTYPYERTRETLATLAKNGPSHPCHGVKVQFINPVTGGYPMPTIAAFMQLLPKNFDGVSYRSTDSTVYSVVEGSGETRIGTQTFQWKEKDTFVVPSWMPVSHHAKNEAILFSFSDRAAQKALGLWREEAPITA